MYGGGFLASARCRCLGVVFRCPSVLSFVVRGFLESCNAFNEEYNRIKPSGHPANRTHNAVVCYADRLYFGIDDGRLCGIMI